MIRRLLVLTFSCVLAVALPLLLLPERADARLGGGESYRGGGGGGGGDGP